MPCCPVRIFPVLSLSRNDLSPQRRNRAPSLPVIQCSRSLQHAGRTANGPQGFSSSTVARVMAPSERPLTLRRVPDSLPSGEFICAAQYPFPPYRFPSSHIGHKEVQIRTAFNAKDAKENHAK